VGFTTLYFCLEELTLSKDNTTQAGQEYYCGDHSSPFLKGNIVC
jgi:hypothetical protein